MAAQVSKPPTHTASQVCLVLLLPAPATHAGGEQPSPEASRLKGTRPRSLLQAALLEAVRVPRRADCLAAIRAALEAGADVNARSALGSTPLHYSARFNEDAEGLTAAVEALLAAGADVRAKDSGGHEPLHWVASNSYDQASAAAVRALLAARSGCAGNEQCWLEATALGT